VTRPMRALRAGLVAARLQRCLASPVIDQAGEVVTRAACAATPRTLTAEAAVA
jgi:hypothetical protein